MVVEGGRAYFCGLVYHGLHCHVPSAWLEAVGWWPGLMCFGCWQSECRWLAVLGWGSTGGIFGGGRCLLLLQSVHRPTSRVLVAVSGGAFQSIASMFPSLGPGGNTSRRSGGGVVGSSDRGCEAVQGLRRTLLSSATGEAGRGEGCSLGLGGRIGRPPSLHWAGGDDTVAHRVAWPDLLFVPEPCGSLGILAMCLDRMENSRGSAGLSEVPS